MEIQQLAYPGSSGVAKNFKREVAIVSTSFSSVFFFRQNKCEADLETRKALQQGFLTFFVSFTPCQKKEL